MDSVVNLLEQYTVKNTKCKRTINDPGVRSLRHLYCIYKDGHDEASPSYTSFKRIFNEHGFAFPSDRPQRSKPLFKAASQTKTGQNKEAEQVDKEIFEFDDYIEEHLIEGDAIELEEAVEEASQPKVIVTQVPESSKFFASPSQVYEIQIIEIPIQSTAEVKCDIY